MLISYPGPKTPRRGTVALPIRVPVAIENVINVLVRSNHAHHARVSLPDEAKRWILDSGYKDWTTRQYADAIGAPLDTRSYAEQLDKELQRTALHLLLDPVPVNDYGECLRSSLLGTQFWTEVDTITPGTGMAVKAMRIGVTDVFAGISASVRGKLGF
jgi:hypothetical protein